MATPYGLVYVQGTLLLASVVCAFGKGGNLVREGISWEQDREGAQNDPGEWPHTIILCTVGAVACLCVGTVLCAYLWPLACCVRCRRRCLEEDRAASYSLLDINADKEHAIPCCRGARARPRDGQRLVLDVFAQ